MERKAYSSDGNDENKYDSHDNSGEEANLEREAFEWRER